MKAVRFILWAILHAIISVVGFFVLAFISAMIFGVAPAIVPVLVIIFCFAVFVFLTVRRFKKLFLCKEECAADPATSVSEVVAPFSATEIASTTTASHEHAAPNTLPEAAPTATVKKTPAVSKTTKPGQRCKACGHPLNKSAKICPNCNKKRNVFERNPALIIIPTILIVALFAKVIGNAEDVTASNEGGAAHLSNIESPTHSAPEPTFNPIILTVSNWEVTITDFYFLDAIDATLLHEYQADENAKFAVVKLTAKNTGKEADVFLPWLSYGSDVDIKLKCDGYTYTRSELLLSDDALSTETLNPLVSASGLVVFNMPVELIESDAEIEIIVSADWQNSSAILR